MAKNPIPASSNNLFASAQHLAEGVKTHEAALKIKQNDSASILADIAAARTAETAFQAALSRRTKVLTPAQKTADEAGRKFIVRAKDTLTVFLGSSWNQSWSEAGFVNRSLGTPTTMAERESTLQSLQDYFLAHPDHEVPAEKEILAVTAERAGALYMALKTARAACMAHEATQKRLRGTRDGAFKTLRKRMSGCIAELKQLLPGDDPLWSAFGLNPPKAAQVPVKPQNLRVRTVTGANGSSDLILNWSDSPGAERYRVFRQIEGVDETFVPVETVAETEAVLPGIPGDARVRIRVSAANDAGESAGAEEEVALAS